MESKIATYSAPKKRIQLLNITDNYDVALYQIRTNRKVTYTTAYESIARKKFASIITSEILQQKFSF